MDNININKKYYIFATIIILLNAFATYIVTTESLNRYIITFDYTFIGILNSFIGNVSFLLLILLITFSIAFIITDSVISSSRLLGGTSYFFKRDLTISKKSFCINWMTEIFTDIIKSVCPCLWSFLINLILS